MSQVDSLRPLGSSPRLRGTEAGSTRDITDFSNLRFIPAPAGNGAGQTGPASSSGQPVHPRACGERFVAARRHVGLNRRFIPAPAGNGVTPNFRSNKCTAHERFIPAPAGNRIKQRLRTALPKSSGSSPRLRGTDRGAGISTSRTAIGSSPRLRGTAMFTTSATCHA